MREKISSLLKANFFKGFAIYLGSSVINKAIPFLLLPILTKYLTPEEYGVLAIYQVMISFVMPLIGMNMQNNITRNFFSKSKEFVAQIIFNMLVVLTIASIAITFIVSVYLYFGGTNFSIPNRWIYALPVLAFMSMLNTFNLTILRNKKKALQFGVFEISKTAIDLSLTVLLVVVYKYSWEGRATGILISTIILGLISFFHIWKSEYILFKFDKKQINEILRISLPLIPHAIGGVIMTVGDRIFIDQMVGTAEMGIYAVGYQFGMIMTLVTTAFNQTWTPWVYELLAKNKEENKIKIVKATYLTATGFVILALVITAISYFLLPLMTTEQYHGAFVYVIWVALGYAFYGMYTLVFPYGVHVGKTSFLGVTTLLAAIINIAGNYILIKINGPVGSAQATLISYVFMFASVWWYSNKLFPMPWFKLNPK